MGKVVVVSTGGTIASRQDARGASVASDASGELLSRLPHQPNVAVTGRDVLRLGSYLLTPRSPSRRMSRRGAVAC